MDDSENITFINSYPERFHLPYNKQEHYDIFLFFLYALYISEALKFKLGKQTFYY